MIERKSAQTSVQSNSSASASPNEVGWKVVHPLPDLKQIEIDSYRMNYAERGSGEPVIFVHGALGDYRCWSQHLDSLSHRFRVISYSRRFHHPNSPNDGAEYTYRTHARDLISLIEKLQLRSIHLVGHSYGGAVAAMVAAERPDLVSSLILGEPSLFSVLSEPNDRVSLRLFRIALNVVQKLDENGEQTKAVREYINIVVGAVAFDSLPHETLLIIRQNAHTLGPMLNTFFDFENLEAVLEIKTPTILIAGDSSPAVYRSTCRELSKTLSRSRLVTLGGTSHGLHMESPQNFNQEVIEFLSHNRISRK